MDKEKFIISTFANSINGDDGAVINNHCYSKDLFCENVHFKRNWMSLEQIGAKAMLVNISDAIVMNSIPKYALLGLSLPKNLSLQDIKKIQQGLMQEANNFKVQIIGGDTIADDKINISITIISIINQNQKAIYRKGLKKDDLLAFSGKLGDSLKGLKILQRGSKLHSTHRFIRPKLRQDFFYDIAKKINASMDISDGLKKDLSRLLTVNRLNIKFLKKLSFFELNSAEEYEILFAFNKKHKAYIENMAKKHRIKINIFAKTKIGRYIYHGKEHHF
ncbi:thiamine-phosphate kinase [Campylobacter insulaenigrae]|uniref:Thiamine-monophosphate kinase n=1 Tax=Campylobacter insulaenigrae NCTC 12927 TaxID=1031564 RepID=A0A0A8H0E6_9BACT|nr:thiamine-phosphate kinase [Campylobacter insulaenigrae]AJC87387.1 thiamine monophosphate kinase [Campylobacter insulaenigrae NCTC 12927]MCR6590807.1 thiamine-phosphate kinase [Campylobacter insulaenigrae]MCR6592484.1 thiamine-phosphate kinase [Campylobacter insulaenigrae]VEH93302.1 thiamine monophosphate kinase [Campylobacter insulaenigrae]VEJ52884.1 thiamine monophosphate kinase [Campylobacter insulaenigrae]